MLNSSKKGHLYLKFIFYRRSLVHCSVTALFGLLLLFLLDWSDAYLRSNKISRFIVLKGIYFSLSAPHRKYNVQIQQTQRQQLNMNVKKIEICKINRLFWSEMSSVKIYSLKINEAGSKKRDTSQQKQSTQQF